MLRVANLNKDIDGRNVLNSIDLMIARGQKIGLVGANGSGKSTLLQILAGLMQPSAGRVTLDSSIRLKYLPQQFDRAEVATIGSYLAPEACAAKDRMRDLELRLSDCAPAEFGSLYSEYSDAAEAFDRAGGYGLDAKIEKTLHGLSLNQLALERPLDSLSGGQRARIGLARALIAEADLLLLDEPTNNLDIESLQWLQSVLKDHEAACLIVSHDRRFLDCTTNFTFELAKLGDGATIKQYSGNYSWFRMRKKQELERQIREFEEQQDRVKRLTADILATKNQSLLTEYATTNDYLRGRSKKVAAKAKARETRLNKMLSDAERVDKPRLQPTMRLQLSGRKLYDALLIHLKEVSLIRSEKTLFSRVNLELSGNQKIALLGANGAGKSSLLHLLMGHIEATSGDIWTRPGLRIGYMSQNQEGLPEQLSVLDYFMQQPQNAQFSGCVEERTTAWARSFLNQFQFKGDSVFRLIHQLSRGERTKLVLSTFMSRQLGLADPG